MKNNYTKLFNSTFGQISFATFFIAIISGIFLAVFYSVQTPFDSISELLLTNPQAALFRNIHYWSAQLFLIFAILHIWDHLRKSTERDVKKGIWLRLTISLIAIFFVMISGFILKGDADSIQAKRILSALLDNVPLIGQYVSYSIMGSVSDFSLIYVHHIATASIFLWIIIIEHAKMIYPPLKTTVYYTAITIGIALLLPTGLHQLLDPVMKGPWYFLGMQELFHFITSPDIILLIITILLLLFYFLPYYKKFYSRNIKILLLVLSFIYLFLIFIGYFFRGENWQLTLPWNNSYFENTQISPVNGIKHYFSDFDNKKEIPEILGQKEGCLYCHDNVKGFSPAHNPQAIGCVSCHGGDPFSIVKSIAHLDMENIPGNLRDASRTCGNTNCHPGIAGRVDNSIMNTMSGVVSVDRYVFDESRNLNDLHRIETIGKSPADAHLRNLCASCHTGKRKNEYGPITQTSRGGGCNTCHLHYDKKALNQLDSLKYKQSKNIDILFHPALNIKVGNDYCFGCHSRSGRISTNYEGWHETKLTAEEMPNDSTYRMLNDGRVFKFIEDDIHHRKGMSCIDCHHSHELMGDGSLYAHQEEQTTVRCEDCHFSGTANTMLKENLDNESEKIVELRKFDKTATFLATKIKNYPLINTHIDKSGNASLIDKLNAKEYPLNPPARICTGNSSHQRVSCNSCHTAWSPQCIGCHTGYNPEKKGLDHLSGEETDGRWQEWVGEFYAEAPTLGIKTVIYDSVKTEIIDTFIPGMVLTMDKHLYDGSEKNDIFKRLFAPAISHTTSAKGRSCKSCHNNPLALGYGRGKLTYNVSAGKGRWVFESEFADELRDSLPQDAWIGFLKAPAEISSTRSGARPFSVVEQKKILRVAACLTCHEENSRMMQNSLQCFDSLLNKVSKRCIVPE